MPKYEMKRPELTVFDQKAVEGKADHIGPIHGVLRETIAGDTSSSYVALKGKIPPYSKVTAVHAKCSVAGAAFSGGTAPADIALGISSNPDALFKVALTSLDAVGDELAPQVPDNALFTGSSSQELRLYSTNSSGAADGDIVGGEYDFAVFYETYPIFEDAA